MDQNSSYYKQVQLLVQLLPLIAEEDCFALKGGTAINLFVRNLPRLSVDIDLVYLPMKGRNEALDEIRSALTRIDERIVKAFPDARVVESYKDKVDALRLVVARNGVQVKIELSPVLRGTVFDPKVECVCEAVEDEFGYAEISMVNLADLYAGKICAALDRQHPRDLFDVMWLLNNEGLTDDIRKALIVYIISHPRPIAELLNPGIKDIKQIYAGEFANMSEEEVSLEELEEIRVFLIELINVELTEKERQFLLSFKNNAPDWKLLGLEGVEALPAVKWKQINLEKMAKDKHREAYENLVSILESNTV
jgi:predicted nucleotidyltransferase component of viral defense system